MNLDINIEEEVLKVIERDFAISRNLINKNSTLDDLKIDKLSTDYVDLLSGLENKFEINIAEDDFLNVINIGDIIDLVAKYIELKNNNEENSNNNENINNSEDDEKDEDENNDED
jgi:acyl carrier protein